MRACWAGFGAADKAVPGKRLSREIVVGLQLGTARLVGKNLCVSSMCNHYTKENELILQSPGNGYPKLDLNLNFTKVEFNQTCLRTYKAKWLK